MLLSDYISTRTLTFHDDFSAGMLDGNNWTVSVGQSPLNGGGGQANGHFTANSVSLALGCLSLRISQNSSVSMGGEISSANVFGFGAYQFTARMGSTANTPTATGNAVSGGISGLFNFINDSNTEIDFECEGWLPNVLELTSWNQPQSINATNQTSNADFKRLSDDFHTYSFIWLPGGITFYIDGLELYTHTTIVPSQPAHIFMNAWGTDGNFGGPRTLGTDRWLYVRNVSFYADGS